MQQKEVLKEHTDLRIGDIVGDMGVDAWGRPRWQHIFASFDVIVCTPMILLNILRRGFAKVRPPF